MSLKEEVIHRINVMPKYSLMQQQEILAHYNIFLFTNEGHFDYNIFKKECIETLDLLCLYDFPHHETYIRHLKYRFIICIGYMVRRRNLSDFLSTKIEENKI